MPVAHTVRLLPVYVANVMGSLPVQLLLVVQVVASCQLPTQ